ncbi:MULTISPECIES: hypothetical protein [Pontibacillus]|uniref:Lipoprotein n=1 Tax=Pontibacillus chungwhensis TaxID=265426 RepID=A0ABY8V019_9BACI|nr:MULTISPECIES: hypothetical protein [Pontibacillus]WIF99287.1 hypothetical protein QNI29_06405 [Pontibacillus chungwhensis]
MEYLLEEIAMEKREEVIINKPVKAVLFATLTLFLLASCGVADGGRVTARDVLKQDKDADILKYNGRIFSNVTSLEWFEDDKQNVPFSKDHYVAEVKNQTKSIRRFSDLSATKLPKGTKVYSAAKNEEGILLVEYEGEELYYMELLEGG